MTMKHSDLFEFVRSILEKGWYVCADRVDLPGKSFIIIPWQWQFLRGRKFPEILITEQEVKAWMWELKFEDITKCFWNMLGCSSKLFFFFFNQYWLHSFPPIIHRSTERQLVKNSQNWDEGKIRAWNVKSGEMCQCNDVRFFSPIFIMMIIFMMMMQYRGELQAGQGRKP